MHLNMRHKFEYETYVVSADAFCRIAALSFHLAVKLWVRTDLLQAPNYRGHDCQVNSAWPVAIPP